METCYRITAYLEEEALCAWWGFSIPQQGEILWIHDTQPTASLGGDSIKKYTVVRREWCATIFHDGKVSIGMEVVVAPCDEEEKE